ncbi:uncharacterized protein LOC105156883 [Sesamum indicum]|uniref:Uncharacterized protein LOC105156883 n=1 Tax=Sesamum indicum TaxID=4182 RepID=A0A6I9SVI6_SESIN|nr:uncharacterized protein LOC105156883 [Sesamum indicum]
MENDVSPLADEGCAEFSDGTKHSVRSSGDIHLTNKICLTNMLHVSDLKFNLLYVSKLCNTSSIRFKFYPSYCVMQDHKAKEVVAVGCMLGRLYHLKKQSFDKKFINRMMNYNKEYGLSTSTVTFETWHRKLRHISQNRMMHIGLIRGNKTEASTCEEPRSFTQANQIKEWREAMSDELEALERNNTWRITKLPQRHSEEIIADIKLYLDKLFTIKDLGPARYFLGLEIARSNGGLTITQAKYTRDIIQDSQAKETSIPLPSRVKLTAFAGKPLPNLEAYRRLLGRLLI